MRPKWWQFGTGVAFGMLAFASQGGGGGIGISTESEPPEPGVLVVDSVLFHPRRVGPVGSFRLRDIEFLGDYS